MASSTKLGGAIVRWLLPLTLLAGGILRMNAVSAAYLCLALVSQFVSAPVPGYQRSWGSSLVLQLSLLLSALACSGQIAFQAYLLAHKPYSGNLPDGSAEEEAWLYIGFSRLNTSVLNALRLVVPDFTVFVVALAGAVLTRADKGADIRIPPFRPSAHSTSRFRTRDYVCLIALFPCAVLLPSALSAPYMLMIILGALRWALRLQTASLWPPMLALAHPYVTCHMLVMYLYQWPFFQASVPPGSSTAVTVGLVPFVDTTYDPLIHPKRTPLEMYGTSLSWFHYAFAASLVLLASVLSYRRTAMRRRSLGQILRDRRASLFPSSTVTSPAPQQRVARHGASISAGGDLRTPLLSRQAPTARYDTPELTRRTVSTASQSGTGEGGAQARDRSSLAVAGATTAPIPRVPSVGHASQGEGALSTDRVPIPRVPSVGQAQHQSALAAGPIPRVASVGHASTQGGSGGREHSGEHGASRPSMGTRVRAVLGIGRSFVARYGWHVAPLGMLIWSIVFHSWPSLVLMVWALLGWLLPRTYFLRSTPLVALYAAALLVAEFVSQMRIPTVATVSQAGLMVNSVPGVAVGVKTIIFLVLSYIAHHRFDAIDDDAADGHVIEGRASYGASGIVATVTEHTDAGGPAAGGTSTAGPAPRGSNASVSQGRASEDAGLLHPFLADAQLKDPAPVSGAGRKAPPPLRRSISEGQKSAFSTFSMASAGTLSSGDLSDGHRPPAAPVVVDSRWAKFRDTVKALLTVVFSLVLQYCHVLCLLALYVCGLQQVALFNAVYMIACVLFWTFPNVARRFWTALVIYTDLVIVALYVWQFPFSDHIRGTWPTVVGLVPEDAGSTLAQILTWHLAILALSLVQRHVYRIRDEQPVVLSRAPSFNRLRSTSGSGEPVDILEWRSRADTGDSVAVLDIDESQPLLEDDERPSSSERAPDGKFGTLVQEWLDWYATASDFLKRYFAFASYTALLCVAFIGPATVLRFGYLLVFFVCCFCHHSLSRPLRVILPLWWLVAIASGMAVIVMYGYQFSQVERELLKLTTAEVLCDLGLAHHRNFALFRYLVGPTAMLLVAVYQVSLWRANYIAALSRVPGGAEEGDSYAFVAWRFFQRLAVLHSRSVVIIVLFVAAITQVSALNIVTMLLLILITPSRKLSTSLAVVVLVWIELLASAKYAYQFSFFSDMDDSTPPVINGTFPVNNTVPATNATVPVNGTLPINGSLPLLGNVAIQVNSRTPWTLWVANGTALFNVTGSSITDAMWIGFNKHPQHPAQYIQVYVYVVLFLVLQAIARDWDRALQRHYRPDRPYNPDVPVPLFVGADGAEDGAQGTFVHMLNNLRSYIGVELCAVIAVCVAFVRLNAFAVVYLILVGLWLGVPRNSLRRTWKAFILVVTLLLTAQYASLVGLPPSSHYRYWWESWNEHWQTGLAKWLYLPPGQSSLVLIADFFLLLFTSLQGMRFDVEAANPPPADGPVEDFTVFPRSYIAHIKIFFFRDFYFIVLAFVFVNGASSTDVLSFGYMISSLYMFRVGETLILSERKRRRNWNALLGYTYFVLCVKCAYQLPAYIVNWDDVASSVVTGLNIIGLQKGLTLDRTGVDIDMTLAWSSTGIVFDFVCFVLILAQRRLFASPQLAPVVNDTKLDRMTAFMRARLVATSLRAAQREQRACEEERRENTRKRIASLRQSNRSSRALGYPSEGLYDGPHSLYPELARESASAMLEHMEANVPTGRQSTDEAEMKLTPSGSTLFDGSVAAASRADDSIPRPVTPSAADAQLVDVGPSLPPQPRVVRWSESEDLVTAIEQMSPDTDSMDVRASEVASSVDMPKVNGEPESLAADAPTRIHVFRLLSEGLDALLVWLWSFSVEYRSIRYWADMGTPATGDLLNEAAMTPLNRSGSRTTLSRAEGVRPQTPQRTQRESLDEENIVWPIHRGVERTRQALKSPYAHSPGSFGASNDSLGMLASRDDLARTYGEDEPFAAAKPALDDDEGSSQRLSGRSGTPAEGEVPETPVKEARGLPPQSMPAHARVIDTGGPRAWQLCKAIYYLWLSHTEDVCLALMVLNNMANSNILSVVYPIVVFTLAPLQRPRPPATFWVGMILYTEFVICVKYLFQFDFWTFNEKCKLDWACEIIGIEKSESNFVFAIGWDLSVLLALFLHRGTMRRLGLWRFHSRLRAFESGGEETVRDAVGVLADEARETFADLQRQNMQSSGALEAIQATYGRRSSLSDLQIDLLGSLRGGSPAPSTAATPRAQPAQADPFRSDERGDSSASSFDGLPLANIEAGVAGTPTSAAGAEAVYWASVRGRTASSVASSVSFSDGGRSNSVSQPQSRSASFQNDTASLGDIKPFFRRMLDTSTLPSRDCYAAMFAFDFVAFIVIMFGWTGFQSEDQGGGRNVATFIRENRIPLTFVLVLLAQFCLIIVDRCIYLRHSLPAKLSLQVLLTLIIHVGVFFLLPILVTGRTFDSNPVLVCWYIAKAGYLYVSAQQIKYGYPTQVLNNFLTRHFNVLSRVLFIGYMAIPFVHELRVIIDWTCTDTTFSLPQWFKMEDIYSQLFSVKAMRQFEHEFPRKLGEKQKWYTKGGVGGLLLFLLLFVVFLPLILIALATQSSVANAPTGLSCTVSIAGYEPLFKMSTLPENLRPLARNEYDRLVLYGMDLHDYQLEDTGVARIAPQSTGTWDVSPPSRTNLVAMLLNSTEDVTIRADFSFFRASTISTVAETIEGSNVAVFAYGHPIRTTLAAMLQYAAPPNGTVPTSVVVPKLFPAVFRLPETGSATPAVLPGQPSTSLVDVKLGLSTAVVNGTQREWWTVSQFSPHLIVWADYPVRADWLEIVTVSDRVSDPRWGFVNSYGLIGLYISVVLVIGRFLRMSVANMSHTIVYDDMPNVDALLLLCMDIYLARETGELDVEETMYWELVTLYRSPDALIQWTKPPEKRE